MPHRHDLTLSQWLDECPDDQSRGYKVFRAPGLRLGGTYYAEVIARHNACPTDDDHAICSGVGTTEALALECAWVRFRSDPFCPDWVRESLS